MQLSNESLRRCTVEVQKLYDFEYWKPGQWTEKSNIYKRDYYPRPNLV